MELQASSKLGCQRVKRRRSMRKSVLEGFGRLVNKMVLLRLRVRWNDHKKTMGYLAFIQFQRLMHFMLWMGVLQLAWAFVRCNNGLMPMLV